MEYKIIISISIILIITLISSVSAEEDTTQLINADGDALGISNDDKLGEVVSGDSFSDIREAVENAKDGDTITLLGTFNGDKKAIGIDKDNLIIKGSGSSKATLDVKGDDSRAFVINGKNVILENLIFKNMKSDKFGIVLVNNTNCQIINCEFMDNTGKSAGIFINDQADYTSIENCIFRNNHAKYDSESGGQLGGAIDSHASHTSIFNSKFSSNSAIDNGGAVYFTRGTDNLVENCEFTSNKAQNGGGIYITSTSAVRVRNSKFNGNEADYGGAIYSNGVLEVESSEFNNNKATVNITTSVPKYVNCSDTAIITANFSSGNNIIDEIWSNKPILIDNSTVEPSFADKNLVLNINGKTFNAKTNDAGVATFNFNTFGFPVKTNTGTISYTANDKTDSANINLVITTKKVIIKNLKKFKTKKKKIYKARLRVYKTKKVKYLRQKYKNGFQIGYDKKGTKKVKVPSKKWDIVKKKDYKKKYYWFKRGYSKQKIKYYKGTITKNLNGVIIVKKYTKKKPYIAKGNISKKVHITHKKDWSDYVLPSTDCQSDDKAIIKKAKAITKGKKTNKEKANAILKWIQKNKIYDGYGNARYGAVKSLSIKSLNCVDSTHLVIALLRACNIPAKYALKDNWDYGEHCWPKVYICGKWKSGEATAHPKKNQIYVKFGSFKNLKVDWDKVPKRSYFLKTYNCNYKMIKTNGKWYGLKEVYTLDNNKKIYYSIINGKHFSLYSK